MTNNNAFSTYDTEHYLQRVLPGNVNAVRRRLGVALERLDYDFIDDGEAEVQAKRAARGWATGYASADLLDYPRTLIIRLKSTGENLTRVSFIYIVKHPTTNRGERDILTREAETIAALAAVRPSDKICAVCATQSADDSRFCRRCGAPMTGDETALEALRMAAETRAGHTSVAIGTFIAAAVFLINFTALVILTASKSLDKAGILLLTGGLISTLLIIVSNVFGWRRLNKALKAGSLKPAPRLAAPDYDTDAPTLSGTETSALPPPPAYSAFEDTTGLLSEGKTTGEFAERGRDNDK